MKKNTGKQKRKLPAKKSTGSVAKKAAKKTSSKSPKKNRLTSGVKTIRKKPAKKGKKKSEELLCFLTTACVTHYGLADNGYELTTLRFFRDTYMAASTKGKALIERYYHIAPVILQYIEKDVQKKRRYAFIYAEVLKACASIEDKKFKKAQDVYCHMVNTLVQQYAM